jgi:hypothetical protein
MYCGTSVFILKLFYFNCCKVKVYFEEGKLGFGFLVELFQGWDECGIGFGF